MTTSLPRTKMTIFYRFKQAEDIPGSYFKEGREMTGVAITVADGDGLRLYHQPLLACSPPNIPRGEVGGHTIKVRLAGIDAPEMGHDGVPSQPFAEEARDYLRSLLRDRTVIVKLHSVDQYSRVVASVYVRRCWFFRKNISLAMVQAGLATVYRSSGAQYGGIKDALEAAERAAQYPKWEMGLPQLIA